MNQSNRPHEVDCLFWGALGRVAASEKEAEKNLCGGDYANGEGAYFRSASGMKLGQVRRNDPDPEWRFTDKDAFAAYIRTEHPGVVETRQDIVGTDKQVKAVLSEHAPELLADVEFIPDEVFADALKHSRESGQAAGPGIEWVEPRGSLVVTADKAAVEFLRKAMRKELDAIYPKALPPSDTEKRAS